jgi:hypothetical protein
MCVCVCVCVCWAQLNTTLYWFISLEKQCRSKKGFAFKVLRYIQRMDKGQLECYNSNSRCFNKTEEAILMGN